MYKNIIYWRWIPRYYRKTKSSVEGTGVVYWYFGLETLFILVMGLVFYCTTIKDASIRRGEMDSQVESLRKAIGQQFHGTVSVPEGEKSIIP